MTVRKILVAVAAAVALISLSVSASASTGPTKAAWEAAIANVPAPGSGCFSASYPKLQWSAVTCVTAKRLRFTVGNGNDYSAMAASGTISKATGTFHDVSSAISEKGQIDATGSEITNAMSLQLNTQFFTGSPTCTAGGNSNCLAWQQFVYAYDGCTSSTGASVSCAFMQYWLINYNNTCPSGWFTYGSDCYTNSNAVQAATVTAKDLASLKLFGSAAKGGNDEVSLTNAGTAVTVTGPDSKIDLAPNWNTTEWGVFGDAGGGEAFFGTNNTLQAQTTLKGTSTAAPKCIKEGFTGETNNLKLTKTPALGSVTTPTMASRQTDGTSSTASCAVGG